MVLSLLWSIITCNTTIAKFQQKLIHQKYKTTVGTINENIS